MLDFLGTRSRNTDPDTSREAAKHSATGLCAAERRAIRHALEAGGPMTARQISMWTGIAYIPVQRRMSETAGIERTDMRRDGMVVWRARA